MSNLTTVLALLRARNESVPKPARLPTEEEVQAAERALNCTFHPDFRRYLLMSSDVVYGTYELAQVTPDAGLTDLLEIVHRARAIGVPESLLPFCEDNGDYFCVTSGGEIVYWSHNGPVTEHWPNLATWIEQVWLRNDEDDQES